MRYTYPKHEKLKSRTVIDLMFTEGKSVSKYPLRLVYVPLPESEGDKTVVGVSVSKKHFKRAHDRNYFKRVLRETYRHHKHLFMDALDKPYAIMFLYQTKDRLPFEQIEQKTVQLFEKFLFEESGKEAK
ncbi:MAG: ribonuclease P protein component [Bacteroidota bacterium]